MIEFLPKIPFIFLVILCDSRNLIRPICSRIKFVPNRDLILLSTLKISILNKEKMCIDIQSILKTYLKQYWHRNLLLPSFISIFCPTFFHRPTKFSGYCLKLCSMKWSPSITVLSTLYFIFHLSLKLKIYSFL